MIRRDRSAQTKRFARWMLACSLALFGAGLAGGTVQAFAPIDAIYQVSVINALLEGVFTGVTPVATLKEYGDFGLGTVHAVDGEMVADGGAFYRVAVDGRAYPLDDGELTPFAAVTFFRPERVLETDRPMTDVELGEYLLEAVGTTSVPFAVRITGEFAYLRTRSAPAQERPYPRLADVIAKQTEFEFRDVQATVVGFWTPGYLDGVNVAGFHFHALTQGASGGGHVLAFESRNLRIELDEKDALLLVLPTRDADFRRLDLSEQVEGELNRLER